MTENRARVTVRAGRAPKQALILTYSLTRAVDNRFARSYPLDDFPWSVEADSYAEDQAIDFIVSESYDLGEEPVSIRRTDGTVVWRAGE